MTRYNKSLDASRTSGLLIDNLRITQLRAAASTPPLGVFTLMDKRQISWLIVRAFGVYLLVQACILLPQLLAGLFTARYYSNVMSSLGSESGNGGSYTRVASSMYRTLSVAPLLRIVLYSAVGLYFVRG